MLPIKAGPSIIFFKTARNSLLPPPQRPHSAPLSSFAPGVGAARLTLDEASRLLTLLWRASLPTSGQCTLHCEQVGGGTWVQRLEGAAGARVSGFSMASPGPGLQQVCPQFGEGGGGQGGRHVGRVTCPTPRWLLQAGSDLIPWGPASLACRLDPTVSPPPAHLC